MDTVGKEANLILNGIAKVMPTHIDGKKAILEMKDGGSSNWRQMEWIGFWFEHLVDTKIRPQFGISVGPSFGRTQFDMVMKNVWDLKAHPSNSSSNSLILNDQEAVDTCIVQHGGFGFVVVVGTADYDESGDFKLWHDTLKGGRSAYERNRIQRGAPSRRRKVAFNPTSVMAVFFAGQSDIRNGLDNRWLGLFQTGMRNSNGVPRRPKYQIFLDRVPSQYIVAETQINSA